MASLVLAVMLLALLVPGAALAQGDPFRQAPPGAPAGQGPGATQGAPAGLPGLAPSPAPSLAPGATPGSPGRSAGLTLPAPLLRIAVRIAEAQRRFNAALSQQMRAVGQGGSWGPALAIMGLAFLYGVFHAAGPGHGKVVTTTYFLARRARILHGALVGGIIAGVQAVTAIVAVLLLAELLQVSGTSLLMQSVYLEAVSYGLIALIGVFMLVGAARGKHGHDGHGSDADLHAPARPSGELLSAAVAAGLRPCSGAILVLLFAIGQGILAVGIAATLAMAVGVALTVTLMGIATILLRQGIGTVVRPGERVAAWAHRAVAVAGSLAIIGLGVLLLLGALERIGTPL